MKKVVKVLTVSLLALAVCFAAFGCGKEEKKSWQFDVGDEKIEYVADGVTQWSPTITVNVKITGGNNTLMFVGKVQAQTTDNMASNFLKAVAIEKGWANDGIEIGFVGTLGEYTNNTETKTYWGYTVNGDSPSFGCSTYQLREGDYMEWTYAAYQA